MVFYFSHTGGLLNKDAEQILLQCWHILKTFNDIQEAQKPASCFKWHKKLIPPDHISAAYIYTRAHSAACNVADQADWKQMFGLLPYSYRFRWFDIKEGTRHFSFFFFYLSGSLLSVCRGNKNTAGTHVQKPFTRTCLFNAITSSTHPPSPPCFQAC